jgi:mono/diheme cytochrome c family protein
LHGSGTFFDQHGHVEAGCAALLSNRHSGAEGARRQFDKGAAARGKDLFNKKAQCATCHVPPLFTEPGHNLQTPAEMGFYQ